ncbi:MAG: hypothetical protein GX318_04380 [Clostridia bacterium]|nr:hypothetical protein [Clostridia bacterium]
MEYKNKIVLVLLFAAVGSLIFISFSAASYQIEAFQFKLGAALSPSGLTEINFPPIGKIIAKTHKTPIKLLVTLENVDMEILNNMLREVIPKDKAVDLFTSEILLVVRSFILRTLFLAALGGVFAVLLLNSDKLINYLRGAFIGVFLASILIAGTFHTYDVNKFLSPQYTGIIKAAPWIVGLAEDALVKVDKLGEQMEVVAANFHDVFQKMGEIQPLNPDEETIKILHVSDIHNNPASYQFIKRVVQTFGVSLVIDTGDLTDYGTPLEINLIEALDDVGVPYVFVPGNHDSPEITGALSNLDNIIVLDGSIIYPLNIPITGIAHPSSHGYELDSQGNQLFKERRVWALKQELNEVTEKPILFAYHGPDIAGEFIGEIPIILHGHTHSHTIEEKENSIIIDAGTSGAAGIRRLQTTKEIPYTFVLLHLNKDQDQDWILEAVDSLEVSDLNSGFILTRKLYNKRL